MLRFSVLERSRVVAQGHVSRIGRSGTYFEVTTDDEPYVEAVRHEDHRVALRAIIDYLHRNSHIRALLDIHAVVHRFPFGGEVYTIPTVLGCDDVLRLHALSHGAPHMQVSVAAFDAALRLLPSTTHVGVFDSGPYLTIPASTTALPLAHNAETFAKRYRTGSDGIIHDAALRAAFVTANGKSPRRTVSVHIDERTSVAAFIDNVIVDTTEMGEEVLPGLHNAGSLPVELPLVFVERLHRDPRVIGLYLRHYNGIAAMAGGRQTYEEIFSGAREQDADCLRALMLLAHRIACAVAGMTVSLGGLDAIIFSGQGASWIVREEVCRLLAHFGVSLDPRLVKLHFGAVHTRGSRVQVFSVKMDSWVAMSSSAAHVLAQRLPAHDMPRDAPRGGSHVRSRIVRTKTVPTKTVHTKTVHTKIIRENTVRKRSRLKTLRRKKLK